jgi:S1-C subfamily serine protease
MNLHLPRAAFSLLLCSTVLAQKPAEPPPRIQGDLGIRFAVTTSKLRRAMVRTTTPYGFAVRSVVQGSLADQAGIARGTVVLTVDGTPLREVAELEAVLAKSVPGQKLVLKCSRHKPNAALLDRHPWEDFEVTLVLPGKRGSV